MDIPTETLDSVREYVQRFVAGGFSPEDEIIEITVACFSDEVPEEQLAPLIRDMTKTALAEHLEAQKDWPEVTDCDRLDKAFAELEASGIVARQNAFCCQTCARHEVWGECLRLMQEGRKVRGYTFYHEQDTESATEGYGVTLCYGSTKRWRLSHLSIAKEVVQVTRRHGLNVKWNGKLNRRIIVEMDWKRRR